MNTLFGRLQLCMMLALLVACEPPTPPRVPTRVVWKAAVPDNAIVPAIDGEQVYFADVDHRLYAVDRSTGAIRWTSRNAEGDVFGFTLATGVVVSAGVVVIADGYLYGINRSSGQRSWAFGGGTAGFAFRPAANDSTVFAGSSDGRLFAVDSRTGVQRWVVRVADDTGGALRNPIVYRDTVYVGYVRRDVPQTGGFAAVDALTGQLLWYRELMGSAVGHLGGSQGDAAIVADLVIAAADDGEIYAMERATSTVRWRASRLPSNGVGDERPLAAAADLILAGSSDRVMTAYDRTTGALRWQRQQLGSVHYAIVSHAGRAYYVNGGGELVAADVADGNVLWTFGGNNASEGPMMSGAAANDSVVFVGGAQAAYALRTKMP